MDNDSAFSLTRTVMQVSGTVTRLTMRVSEVGRCLPNELNVSDVFIDKDIVNNCNNHESRLVNASHDQTLAEH